MAERAEARGGRAAILEAATELFARRGFGGVAVQEIADQAGVHKTTVLYQFGTKEALHEAVLDHALEPVISMMNDFLDGEFNRERLSWYLDQLQRHVAADPSVARLMLRELLEGGEYGDAYLDRFVGPVFEPAKRRLQEARVASDGRVAEVDPALFVHDLHVQIMSYFCHGALLERLLTTDPYSVDALIARRNYLVDQILAQQRPHPTDDDALREASQVPAAEGAAH
ncbi:MAG: TetR family transcriptional regulator [Acidimicrobiia bacterium]